MKKTIALLCAIAATNLFAVPVYAVNPTSGSTLLSYNVAANYAVTIPPVTINAGSTTANGTYMVNSGSLIEAGKKIQFKITGATNYDTTDMFRLVNAHDATAFLKYSIAKSDNTPIAMNDVFLEVTPSTTVFDSGASETLTYTITDSAKIAGNYSDTLTITISCVDA